jgi:hypothetical protein
MFILRGVFVGWVFEGLFVWNNCMFSKSYKREILVIFVLGE